MKHVFQVILAALALACIFGGNAHAQVPGTTTIIQNAPVNQIPVVKIDCSAQSFRYGSSSEELLFRSQDVVVVPMLNGAEPEVLSRKVFCDIRKDFDVRVKGMDDKFFKEALVVAKSAATGQTSRVECGMLNFVPLIKDVGVRTLAPSGEYVFTTVPVSVEAACKRFTLLEAAVVRYGEPSLMGFTSYGVK